MYTSILGILTMQAPSRPTEARFQLVQAASRFLFTAVPLRRVESRNALNAFVSAASACTLPLGDLDAVLVRVLAVLNPQMRGRFPGLVDRYLASTRKGPGDVSAFHDCVDDLLRARGVADPDVEAAVAFLESHYLDSSLDVRAAAAHSDLSPASLSARFKAVTGATIPEYLRGVRLDHAARLLVTNCKSVKEIWAGVGYNHPANFDHDFKRRFAVSPREYRTGARCQTAAQRVAEVAAPHPPRKSPRHGVMIVDDDVVLCDTTQRYLSAAGYAVTVAPSGADCLREAARRQFAAMVIDYRLPDVDGVTLLRTLRSNTFGPRGGVALFTADWSVEEHREEIRDLGATVVSKLCDLDELGLLVESLCAMPLDHTRRES